MKRKRKKCFCFNIINCKIYNYILFLSDFFIGNMSKNTFFRLADADNEPLNTLIDSDDVCFPSSMLRIIELVPAFNMMIPFWKECNIQLDTVFECFKNFPFLLDEMQDAENQCRKFVSTNFINPGEEISLISLRSLKNTVDLYRKYFCLTNILLKNNDLPIIKECFIEFVRRNLYYDRMSRFNSVFLFDNQRDVEVCRGLVNKNHNETVCKVELKEMRRLEKYDGNWLSDVSNDVKYFEFLNAAKFYWSGKTTRNPEIEYHFSGKYVLREAL